MAINLEAIIHKHSNAKPRWQSLRKNKNTSIQFSYALAAVVEYCFIELSKRHSAYNIISSLFDKHFIIKLLKTDLSRKLGLLFQKIAVYELHSANEHGFLTAASPQARFNEFIDKLSETDNLIAILNKYPEFHISLKHLITNYLKSWQEFFGHFNQDWPTIQTTFFPTTKLTKLISINASGDTHCQGRRVVILTLQDQQKQHHKLVYKPRSLAIDIAFQHYLQWLNKKNNTINLYIQNIMDYGDHGWSEFIDYLPCKSIAEIKQFYQRSGALLAVLYSIGGNDIHAENLIAHGAHPVIIDLECLFKPTVNHTGSENFIRQKPSVIDSLLLPYKLMVSKDFAGLDLSAVSGKGNQLAPYKTLQWQAAGSDAMRAAFKPFKIKGFTNLPFLRNKTIDPLAYENDMITGFNSFYKCIEKHKKILISKQSPCQQFKTVKVRALFRATGDYAKLLMESYHPQLYHYPQERKQHFAWLKKIVDHFPSYKYLIASEQKDLVHNDIPYFYFYNNKPVFYNSYNKPLKIPMVNSGWQSFKQHLTNDLCNRDLNIQQHIIRTSFLSARLNKEQKTKDSLAKQKSNKATLKKLNYTKEFQHRARKLAREVFRYLESLAIFCDGYYSWPTITLHYDLTWNPATTDLDLYGGNAGICLSFGYAGKILNNPHYQKIAAAYVNHVKQHIAVVNPKLELSESALKPAGMFSGIGGIIYTLAKLNTFKRIKQLPELLITLKKLTNLAIEQDRLYDIIGGSAGLLASLLTAKAELQTRHFDTTIKRAVQYILKNYPQPNTLPSNANSEHEQPLVGFSHGVSGLAWALNRYLDNTPNNAIVQWISAALDYEHTLYSPRKNNWCDLRAPTKKNYMLAWCHGAPGIALSKLELLNNNQIVNSQLLAELKTAIKSTLTSIYTLNSTCLCHGTFGNFDILMQARAQQPTLIDEQQYYGCLDHILKQLENNGFANDLIAKEYITGLMLGVAGIGYQLLRIAHPQTVTSILTLD